MTADGRGQPARTASGTRAAITALQAALAAEQAASYGYGIVGAHLSGSGFAQASADCVAHERARDVLEQLILALGGSPQPAPAAYDLPVTVRSAAEAVTLAVLLEHQVARAYLAMVALPEPRLRSLGARGLRDTAVRAAQWTGRPEAFPGLPPPARRPGRG